MIRKCRSILRLALLLAVASAATAAGPEGPAARTDLYYGLAKGNYLVGDIAGARSAIGEVLRLDPGHRPTLALRARILLDEGAAADALEASTDLLARDPGNMEFRLLHALTLAAADRKAEALATIETVLRDAPAKSVHRGTAHQLLGLLRMADGEWAAAAEAFDRAYDASGGTASRALGSEAQAEAAAAFEAAGKTSEAIAAYTKALELSSPGESHDRKRRHRLLIARARLLARGGEVETAIHDLRTVTEQDSANAEAATLLGSLYAAADQWGSVDAILPVIRSQPGLEDIALYFEGRSAFAENRLGTARARFEEALDRLAGDETPLHATLRFYRGACLLRLERREEGTADILEARTLGFAPETIDEALILAGVLIRSDRADEAVDLLEPLALRTGSGPGRLWRTLGRAHRAAGNPALALSALSLAIATAPDDAESRALRAGILRSLDDFDGAAADYAAALQADPGNPAYAYALGLVRLQQGAIPQAERAFDEAAARLQANPGVQILHALTAFVSGKHTSARTSLDRYTAARGDAPANETTRLLRYCLDLAEAPDPALARFATALREGSVPAESGLHLYHDYFAGELAEDALLNHAGRADNPEAAARQICEAAFWMAQHESLSGHPEKARTLLRIVIETGQPDLPEHRLAAWQLRQSDAP